MATVCIVGGGLLGVAAAARLAARHRVVLVEQGLQLGAEATAQNAGMQRRLVKDPVERRFAIRAGELLCDPTLAPYRRRVGGVVAVDQPGPWRAAVDDARSAGLSVRDVSGAIPAAVGVGLRHRAAWLVEDEHLLDADGLASWAWGRARARGAVRRLGARAHLEVAGGRVVGVRVGADRVAADHVLLAGGAWCAGLAAELGLRRHLRALARHLLLTAADARAAPSEPWVWQDDLGWYARPEGRGWLTSPCDEVEVAPPDGAGSRGGVDPLAVAVWLDKVERAVPALRHAAIVSGWTGLRTFAPDRRPVIGEDPEVAGLFWCAGAGGFGISCGLALAEAAASLVDGDPPPWLQVEAVSPARLMPAAR